MSAPQRLLDEDFRSPPRSTFFSQLWVMIGRNIKLKRKSIKLTIAEIVIPCLFLLQFTLLGFLSKTNNRTYPEIPEFIDEPLSYPGVPTPFGNIFPVAYAPENDKTVAFIQTMSDLWTQMNSSATLFSIGFASERDIERAWLNASSQSLIGGVAVIFNDANFSRLDYTLRYPPNFGPPTSEPYFRDNDMCRPKSTNVSTAIPPSECTTNAYSLVGFSGLQNVISTAYMRLKNINIDPPKLSTKMMPERELIDTMGGEYVASLPANQLSNLLAFYVVFLVIFIVTEKEKKLIESMKIMGLRPTVYWISWIVLYAGIMLVMSLIALSLAKALNVWPRSDFFLLLIACMLYGGTMIAFGFCIIPFFRRPLIAGLVTYALTQVFGFLYMVETFTPTITDGGRFGLAVIAPTAFFMAMSRVARAESHGYGIGFGNAWTSGFSFGHAVLMIAADGVFYALLAVYLQKVFPSDDSPKQKPWFFLLPSYWLPDSGAKPSHSASMTNLFESGDVEKVPEEVRAKTGIAINGLRKVFRGKSGVVAVKDFTYEVYENEILGILGHNGAGKTTLINMLTGMSAPTSGNAFVYGRDITDPEQLKEARTLIGICPQHDILFHTFTVREHIVFYARLKGFSNKAAHLEFERVVDEMGLRTHADVKAQQLSGGQKRRLSIAIAVVGSPKVLILDEPTSGVDPYSRKFLWDLMRGFRKNRCIIVTTQSMQEADILADRKLIMSHGKLRCAGTSLFLKNRFGLGYHLTMAVKKDMDHQSVTDIVVSNIVGAHKTRSHAGELCYVLPKDELPKFPKLFDALDGSLSAIGVDSYGVSLTTLEEIFLRLADDESSETSLESYADREIVERRKRTASQQAAGIPVTPVRGSVPFISKFWHLFKVRNILLLRSKLAFIFHFFIPTLLVVMTGILSRLADDWMSKLFGTSKLQVDGLMKDFIETGTKMVYENSTGGNIDAFVAYLQNVTGPVENVPYSTLLNDTPHYSGFRLDQLSSISEKGFIATMLYNSSALHSVPYATNAFLSSVYQFLSGSTETFRVASHPLPSNTTSPFAMTNFMFTSMLLSSAVSMIPGVYGMDVCRDRQLKLRSQIRMAGASMKLYWSSAFVAHFLQFSAAFALMIGLIYAFGITSITDAIGCIVVLFCLHGPAMVLFCYCASFLFTKAETAALGLPFPLTMLGFLGYMVVMVLDSFKVSVAAKVLHYVFAFAFPFYGFYGTMIFIQKTSLANLIAAIVPGGKVQGYFDWDTQIPVVFVAHAVQIPILILLIGYLECRFFSQSFRQFLGIRTNQPRDGFVEVHSLNSEDSDVAKERERVTQIDPLAGKTYAILLRGLWKNYSPSGIFARIRERRQKTLGAVPNKFAVKNLSMVFPKGEVFGLLGPNGAGKTTTISMITGELTSTMGDIYVNGHNMRTDTVEALHTMGSCPQMDTLWEDLTMKEHLELFAVLNDLPKANRKEAIDFFTSGLAISEHFEKKAAALSGGTKRKLTFVISMIGNPPLVLLDEPSTGMDPQSKRYLWDMIMRSFTGDRGAILTTHSMEEADALSDRIGILIKGELRCVGSSQHLKNKFGSGYVLELKVGSTLDESSAVKMDYLKRRVAALFPGSVCTEEVYNRLVFNVSRNGIKSLGKVFAELERVKEELDLEEYSFSQTTVEQVFLHFAKLQETLDGEVPFIDTSGPIVSA